MIDLHLHTTRSDGRLTPAALVAKADETGLRVIAVTDHDTVAAIDEVTVDAGRRGLRVVPGIEVTAVDAHRDVHMLGYFIDHLSPRLAAFLEAQRALRVDRIVEIGDRLARLGAPIDVDAVIAGAAARPGTSVGRPLLARALVQSGHAADMQDAFDRFLAEGRPAFVPRTGRSPLEVVEAIHDAGGIASFAHPGVTGRDALIEPLAAGGLDALEAYHSDHSLADVARYRALAARLGLAISGGSDFHGEPPASASAPSPRRRRDRLGEVELPAPEFARLEARAAARGSQR
ncbi:MAG: PHP domain-containing protein [Acidobacteriota bacterium]